MLRKLRLSLCENRERKIVKLSRRSRYYLYERYKNYQDPTIDREILIKYLTQNYKI